MLSQAATVYDHIRTNNIKIFLLVLLFPISLCALFWGFLYLFTTGSPETYAWGQDLFYTWAPVLFGGVIAWCGVSYFFGDKMMLNFANAKPMKRDGENQRVYQDVGTVALAAGLPTPDIYIIEDDSLNAFATGHSPKTASIALSRGIVNKLSPIELQAVIAHEMAHIGNRDIRLMMIIITGLGVFGLLADIILRVRPSRNSKDNRGFAILMALGMALLVFNWIVAPLIRLAISRQQEYNADATAALVTRNPMALADALQKIQLDPRIEVLDEAPQMAVACIFDPRAFSGMDSLDGTHPKVGNRIKRLRQMAHMG